MIPNPKTGRPIPLLQARGFSQGAMFAKALQMSEAADRRESCGDMTHARRWRTLAQQWLDAYNQEARR